MSLSGCGPMVELLARRAPVLQALRQDPSGKGDLMARLDVSRSTVDRSIRELQSNDLIERVEGTYRPTLAGRIALASYEEFSDRAESVQADTDILACLPPDAPLSTDLLVGSETVRAEPTAPQRPIEALQQAVASADRIRGSVVGVTAQFVDAYRRRVASGCEIELVVAADALSRLVGQYADAVEELIESGRVELREVESTPPYSLKIYDSDGERRVAVAVYGDNSLRALIRNDTSEAVRWAEDRYGQLRAASEPVTGQRSDR